MSDHKGEKEPKLLPVAEVDGREFLVDIENRLFRKFANPDEVIGMHSTQGRQMVKDMQGRQWHCHGLFTGIDEAEA